MTIIEILQNIFGKKKKAIVPKPVIFTPPAEPATEDKNDFNFQVGRLDLKRKELGQLQANYNNYTATNMWQTQAQKDARFNEYSSNRAILIKDIQDRAINLKRLFSSQINNTVKTYYAQTYGPIRKDINDNFNNILLGESYAMTFAIDRTTPATEAPNAGAAATNLGATATNLNNLPSSNVSTTPTTPTAPTAPRNDGTFPDWTNKDYTPNTTVYYLGKLYKTITSVYGNNNNTPNLDGRWIIL